MTTRTNTAETAAHCTHGSMRPVRTGLIARLIQIWRNRRETESLLELSDHQLADIGLTRADVDCALRVPLTCDPTFSLRQARQSRLSAYHED